MSHSRHTPAGSRPSPRHLLVATLFAGVFGGCNDPNTGIDPPVDNLFFPEGLLLDPRTPDGRAARYLFVSNGNNDLNFNGGALTVVDLDAFFRMWSVEGPPDAFGDPTYTYEPYPYCEGPGQRCVLDVGARTTDDFPCRRLGLLPQVVECDEEPFVVDAVRLGDFATQLGASTEPSGKSRLWIPVRGDPSVTFVDVDGAWPDAPDLECGQRKEDGEAVDEARCADEHRLTHLRNDRTLAELPREPFNVHVAETPDYRYAFVAHSAGPALSVIDLDGLQGGGGPAIVDINQIFNPTSVTIARGGFGLATRPCGACGVEGEESIPGFNEPALTRGCTQPLVYGSLRYQLLGTSFTVSGIEPEDLPPGATERDGCEDAQGNYMGPFCATPEQVGNECAILCEPQVRNAVRFLVGGVDPETTLRSETLGDVRFGDACGDELYVLQTNPGALLRLDTSLEAGEPLDIPAGRPIEVCDQPTRFQLWPEEGLAFVACFQAAYVYVVDLRAEQVVDTIITGTGPHDLVFDEVRGMLYVANLLEGSISVIDVSLDRPTRFKEVARIGLQEPFSR